MPNGSMVLEDVVHNNQFIQVFNHSCDWLQVHLELPNNVFVFMIIFNFYVGYLSVGGGALKMWGILAHVTAKKCGYVKYFAGRPWATTGISK